jgi:hypothetical protein
MFEVRDRLLTIPTLNSRLDAIRAQIQTTEDEVAALLKQYERESRDVARIQEESFSAFLYKLVGKYEDKLEKEQREEINAKIAYDRAVSKLSALIRDKEDIGARITRLLEEKRRYEAELESRRRQVSAKLSEPENRVYDELNSERNGILSQATEIDEALRVVSRIGPIVEEISKSLDSAEGWATFDAFTRGGIISHMAKYSHIDEAERGFNALSHELRELKSELRDIEGISVSGLSEISSVQRAVDFWFDNIFTDLSVRGQIKDNAAQIDDLKSSLNAVEAVLHNKRRDLDNKLARNRQSEEELLLSL